jgi:tetratricopeptide (TPR) repeat protein
MAWVPYGDGLKYEGSIHFNTGIITLDIERLRTMRRGNPDTVCNELLNVLKTNIAEFKVIKRLSKWCTWESPRQEMIARRISYFLFGAYCKRLTLSGTENENDKLISDWKERYQKFVAEVTGVDYKVVINKIIGRMSKALTAEDKIILAEDAEPGNYFCIECHSKVHWRDIVYEDPERNNKYGGPQFYHWRRQPECPLCSDGNGGWDEEYYKEHLNINYQERWIETIDELRYFGNFEWLIGKEWAINPLKFYLDDLKKNRETEKDAIFDAESLLNELNGIIPPKNTIKIKSEKSFMDKAKDVFISKDYNRAIELYTSAINLNPNSSFAYNNRGRAYSRKKEYEKAITDFNTALSISPEYGAALNNLGVVFFEQKLLDKALEYFRKALDHDSYSTTRLFNFGQTMYCKAEYEKAIEVYLKIIDIPSLTENTKKDVYTCLSKAYAKLGDLKNAKKYE